MGRQRTIREDGFALKYRVAVMCGDARKKGRIERPFQRDAAAGYYWRQDDGRYVAGTVDGYWVLVQLQLIEPPLSDGDRMKVLP